MRWASPAPPGEWEHCRNGEVRSVYVADEGVRSGIQYLSEEIGVVCFSSLVDGIPVIQIDAPPGHEVRFRVSVNDRVIWDQHAGIDTSKSLDTQD